MDPLYDDWGTLQREFRADNRAFSSLSLAVRGFSRIDRALAKKMNAGGISAAWVAPVLMASPSALKLVKYRPRARGIFSSLFAGCCRLQQHHFGVHL